MFLEISGVTDTWVLGIDVGIKEGKIGIGSKSVSRGDEGRTYKLFENPAEISPMFTIKESQSPTISYVVPKGKQFEHMMTPISLDITLKMMSSGWKLQHIFNMCVEKVNGIKNVPTESAGPFSSPLKG